ncbi:uncharacterized protein LOC122853773 [Aphidius gifuensis]|uniref:uncharacterized protein LOC122853773 n=1 Tax=Aphidius gifuensis TaxID=684658 RepID=UPI001CDC5642|nr:uncharacterized protein LOC122853773 [Aphidius gifuensis]
MKKSRYKSLWESHKHDKTFSDAIGVSLHRLQKEKLIIDSTDDEISSQSTRLGVKIFKAIMNVRKSFLMKEKLKELNVKLKGSKEEEEEMSEDDIQNESMRIDHQQVSETLEKHQKSSVTEILESEADVTEMNDDQMSNNSTYSIGHDEEVEEYLTMDGEEPCKDNFDENHSNYNNELNNKNKSTSSAVSLSEQNTQQFTTGGVKRKLMNNDSSLSTTQNKRLCLVEISTSVGINQQPEPRSTSAPKNYKLKEKALDSSLQNEQNDNHQYDENSWKPTTRLQINNITADYETQALYKKISCILNKLTAENMDKLTQQVRDLNINSHEKLKSLVDLVFDRAIDEPYFAAIYSMMCKKLADMQVDVVDMRRKNKTNFHTLLLERCQHEFLLIKRASVNKSKLDAKLKEIDKCNDIEKKRKLIALLNDADCRLGRKAVGNIRLIGELFKQDMLRISIIDRCIKDLFATPVDYNIECLCKLLTTVGAQLENSKNNNFDYYFRRMSSLASNKKLSSRVRYMVQYVIDLRAQNWIPKRDESYPIIMNQFNNSGSHQYQRESSWKPTRFQTCRNTDNLETQTLYAKVRFILIQLTPENVDKLTQQFEDLNINTHKRLEGVVDLIFEKAIVKPNFASVYALMCKKLSQMDTNVVNMRQENKTDFRTLLVTRCKQAFESVSVNRRDKLTTSLDNADRRLCMKAVGNIKLIGELFKQNMIGIVVIDACIKHLLATPFDYNIECLCELLKTIGPTLENPNNYNFNYYFFKMSSLVSNEELSSRVRSLLQDVIDLRAQNWEPERDEGNLITVNQVSKEGSPSRKEYENIEGELEMITTNNEPTEINKQPYAIATSTSTTNQQTSIQLPGSNNTGATTIYISDNKTFDMYSDSPQSPELETTATSQSSTSLLYVIYSQLDEQIKSLINIAIDEFKNKIDHLNYPEFIRRSLEVTKLESLNVREKYWGFVANMITIGIFPLAVFQSEYDKMFEEIKDVSPIFWTYKAEILKILVKRGAHPLKELKRTTLVLKKKGLVGNLVGELLKILVASEGPSAITEKWNNSGIEWTDLLNTSLENPDDIIKRYNLQFLTFGKTDPLNEQLLKLLRKSNIADTFKWIAINVGEETSRTPKFVRKLFTLLLESGIETKYSFDKRNFYQPNRLKIINLLPLMKDYIDGNLESELQCLYGLTNVNHRCKNPPGFVYDIIKELHEKDIISLGAFYVWHNGTAATSELIGHDEAKWNLLSQSFWIKFQESRT